MQLSKEIARRRFSGAARTYETWSAPQQAMADWLMATLPDEQPDSILEIGCGTGVLTRRLRSAYPDAEITAVDIAAGMIEECSRTWTGGRPPQFLTQDAETLALDREYELVASNSCFQWFTDLGASIQRLAGHLRTGGLLAFTAPVPGTLSELYESYRAATGGGEAGHPLPTLDDYQRAISHAGLSPEAAEERALKFDCRDPEEALQSLRGIGATRAAGDGSAGLTRTQLQLLIDYYRDHFGSSGGVTCTYRVARVVARRR
jgi:malonyl-CoA O-methyltransferase